MDEDVRSAGSNADAEPREVALKKRDGVRVFHARPMKGGINYKLIRDRIHERFSKTIAYLAK